MERVDKKKYAKVDKDLKVKLSTYIWDLAKGKTIIESL